MKVLDLEFCFFSWGLKVAARCCLCKSFRTLIPVSLFACLQGFCLQLHLILCEELSSKSMGSGQYQVFRKDQERMCLILVVKGQK